MVDNRIGGPPVVDGRQRVVGVITESDIFRAFVEMQGDAKTAARAKPRPARQGGDARRP